MEPVLVISLLIAVFLAAGIGLAASLVMSRSRRHDAQAEGLVERVISVAGDSFDSRLRAGAAELDHHHTAIDLRMTDAQQRLDEQLGAVVASLQAKVEEVDKLVVDAARGNYPACYTPEYRSGPISDVGNQWVGVLKNPDHTVFVLLAECAPLVLSGFEYSASAVP